MRSASDRMASSGSRSSFAARYLDVPGGGGGGDGGEESPRAGSGERDRLLGRPPQGRGGARVSTARAVTYEPGAASFSAGNYARLVGESSLSSQRQASAPAGGMPQLRVPQPLPAIRVPSMPVGGSSALPNTPARSLSLLQVSQLDQVELSVLEVSDSGAARHRRMGRVALLRELNAGARGPGGVSLRVPGLELGELRRVNPSRRVSQGSCALLVRRGCVLVSLEKVNALVTADRVYIVLPSMDSDGAQSTRGSAYHLHPPPRDSSPDVAGNSDTIPKNLPPLYRQLVDFLKQAAEDARLEAENGPLPDAEQTGTPRRRDSKRGLGLVGASPGRSFSSDLPASGLAGDESPPGRKSEVEMNALGADEDGTGIGEPFKVTRSRSADAKMIAPDLASEASVLPFGLRAIDLLLSAAVRMLQQRVERTEIELARALEDVTKKTSLRALEITKQHKGEANKLRSVVQDMDEVLEKRLQDKEDLIAMEEVANILHDDEHEADKRIMGQRAELVIDASAMDMEDLIDRMELLEKEIDSTEDLLSLKLDTMRNQILKVEVALALVQIPLALGAMISGIFGMNLYSGYEEERSPVFFWLVAGAIMLMTIIGTAFSFLFMGRSGIMKALDS